MINKDTTFIIKEDKIYQVYGVLTNSLIVYDRQSSTGLTAMNEYNTIFDCYSLQFQKQFIEFINLLTNDLAKLPKQGYDNWTYSHCILSNINKALGLENFISDDEDDDVRSEITVRMTYEYLAKFAAPAKLYHVKLYIIEQLLQKSYYHILNDEWLKEKVNNSDVDTLEYSDVKIVVPEGV